MANKANKARATATILAALRYWQQDLIEAETTMPDKQIIIDNAMFFAEDDPLTSEEIDDLCEVINAGGTNINGEDTTNREFLEASLELARQTKEYRT